MTKTGGGSGAGTVPARGGHMDVIERLYQDIPAFSDVFTEETFYMFAICFVITTIALAFVLSRYIILKPFE